MTVIRSSVVGALLLVVVGAGLLAQEPKPPAAAGGSASAAKEVSPAPPVLSVEQKLTLKDKLRDATEAARLTTPDVMAKEIADFMAARIRNAQEKGAAFTAYHKGLPQVDGFQLTQEGDYVKQK